MPVYELYGWYRIGTYPDTGLGNTYWYEYCTGVPGTEYRVRISGGPRYPSVRIPRVQLYQVPGYPVPWYRCRDLVLFSVVRSTGTIFVQMMLQLNYKNCRIYKTVTVLGNYDH